MYNFSKYHGLGNDFILFDAVEQHPNLLDSLSTDKIQWLCTPKYGVGGDGIIVITPTDEADFGMRLFNADGSEAELSGNGLRCLALFIRDRGLTSEKHLRIKTGGGINTVEIMPGGRVRAGMPQPDFRREHIPMTGSGECVGQELLFDGKFFLVTALAVGNPHCVLFGKFSLEEILRWGPVIENSEYFPSRVNVEFASLTEDGGIDLTVFERGVGVTDACGTGATAAVCAAIKTGKLQFDRPVTVRQKGGDLEIIATDEFEQVFLTGEAAAVFSGEIEL
ncbi:MAG: diaminopimelate epimerase [FCB group bacterium]|nr:diaminopimelate epimerase [FCB group bacterium]